MFPMGPEMDSHTSFGDGFGKITERECRGLMHSTLVQVA